MGHTEQIISMLGRDLIVLKQSDAGEAMLRCLQNAPVDEGFANVINSLPLSNGTKHYAPALYKLTKCIGAKSVVELGVRESVSSFSFLSAMDEDGKLFSFDPVQNTEFFAQYNMSDEMKARWSYYPLLDFEGYGTYGDQIKDFDLLFIDTDPHSFEQATDQFRRGWINNLKPGGFILLDDASPNHQGETFVNRENRTWDVGAQFGILAASMDFVLEAYDKIDYAFSIENTYSDGLMLIKLKG